MARLFPIRSEAPTTDGTPRVVDLDDEDADDVFGALSSTTARQIYATLDEDPGTPSDVADAIDSSIQNVRYHLEKLEDAGLVEVVDTWYSSRGNEMSVYATANGPLIVTSDESRAAQLKQAVSRYIGGIGVLAAASLVVQAAAMRFGNGASAGSAGGADGSPMTVGGGDTEGAEDSGGGAETGGEDADFTISQEEETETDGDGADDAAGGDGADDAAAGDGEDSYDGGDAMDSGGDGEPDGFLDATADLVASTVDGMLALDSPGLLFFLGGVAALSALIAYWYVTTYRPATRA